MAPKKNTAPEDVPDEEWPIGLLPGGDELNEIHEDGTEVNADPATE